MIYCPFPVSTTATFLLPPREHVAGCYRMDAQSFSQWGAATNSFANLHKSKIWFFFFFYILALFEDQEMWYL